MEASWATGKWGVLEQYIQSSADTLSGDFNVNIGLALLALHKGDAKRFIALIGNIRESIAKRLSRANTASLQACHEELLELHVLSEVELISGVSSFETDRESVLKTNNLRLPVLGAFSQNKQYLLSLRRATMQLSM